MSDRPSSANDNAPSSSSAGAASPDSDMITRFHAFLGPYDVIPLRAATAAVVTGIGAGTIGYYQGGAKIGALYGYSMFFGSGIAAFATLGGAMAIQQHRGVDDFKNHLVSWSLTGATLQAVMRRSILAAGVGGVMWGVAGAAYKLIGDSAWDGTRNHWMQFRAGHSLPLEDLKARKVFQVLDKGEKEELSEFVFSFWRGLAREGQAYSPRPRYGPLVEGNAEAMRIKAEEDKKMADLYRQEEEEREKGKRKT